MALTTRRMAGGDFFSVTVTFDDVTGVISHLDWTVASGTLTVTVHRDPQPDLVRTVTADGGIAVPAGYNMIQNAKGAWVWSGASTFEMNWSST